MVVRKDGKMRLGKGFSKGELKDAGVDSKQAPRLTIPVDLRRKTRHEENVNALKEYLGLQVPKTAKPSEPAKKPSEKKKAKVIEPKPEPTKPAKRKKETKISKPSKHVKPVKAPKIAKAEKPAPKKLPTKRKKAKTAKTKSANAEKT